MERLNNKEKTIIHKALSNVCGGKQEEIDQTEAKFVLQKFRQMCVLSDMMHYKTKRSSTISAECEYGNKLFSDPEWAAFKEHIIPNVEIWKFEMPAEGDRKYQEGFILIELGCPIGLYTIQHIVGDGV